MRKNLIEKIKRSVTVRNAGIPGYIREDLDLLVIIIALALFLRIYFAVIVDFSQNPTIMAELQELDAIILGGGWYAYHPPLQTLFLRIIYSLFGASNHQAVFVIQSVLSLVLVPAMYVTGRLICDRGAGILAAAISAIYPNFIYYNLTTHSDSLGMIIVALIMTTAVLHLADSGRTYISAVLIGIGILFKPLLAYMLPGMLLTARKKVLFIAISAVILAPWTIRNSVSLRRFVPVYYRSAFEIDLRKFEAKHEKWAAIHKIYFNASTALRKSRSTSLTAGDDRMRNSNYAAAYSYVIIMILGLTGIARYGRKEHLGIIAPVIGYVVLLIVLSDFKIKFRIYLEPLLILYTAVLVTRSGGFLRKKMTALKKR